ncbi:beta strand repeat-containing protein [Roseateles sp.]|uniref:beta strand repeat-containing protein n=1 Tax=Roseateles sp. TaxID=1971397 RepID=UPI00286AD9BA|nr:PEP-CTERM sorting domain-containing protein [Roseateles sp.]
MKQTFNVKVDAYQTGTKVWDGGLGGMDLNDAWLRSVAGDSTLTLTNKVAISRSAALLGDVANANATLNIRTGTSASNTTLTLGRDFGSQGTVLVDGALSKLTNTSELVVGHGSTGTITVQNGGTLNSANTFIGKVLGGDGLVVISGATSTWVNTGKLTIGEAGAGSLRAEAGAKLSGADGMIGNLDGSAGAAKVTGANSAWTLSNDLQVGKLGEGSLIVEQGGLVVVKRNSIVGEVGDAGTSNARVTGAGSRWQTDGLLIVNNGSLDVAEGGVVSAKTAYLGWTGSPIPVVVNLSGAGSALTGTDGVLIGNYSSSAIVNLGTGATLNTGAILTISPISELNLNGGTLNTGAGYSLGRVNLNSGTVNVSGNYLTGTTVLGTDPALGQGMNLKVVGELQILAGHSVSLNGGQAEAVKLINSGELAVGSFSQLSLGIGGMSNVGAVQLAGGKISTAGAVVNNSYLAGFGVIGGAGGFSNTGLLRQTGGSFELATMGANINTGNWEMVDGRGLVLSGATLTNSGVMSLSGDTISGRAVLINGTAGTLTGRGVISAPFQNDGRMTVDAGNLRIDPNFSNSGQILMGSTTATLAGGDLWNAGRIQGAGQINNAILNYGTVGAMGGTLTLGGAVTNNGIISAGLGATVLLNRGLASNTGKIQLNGGGFDNNGFAMSNEATGVINGSGTLSGGLLTNKGKVLLSGGTSTIYNNVLGTNASQIILSGNSNTTLYGTVDVQSGAELRVSTGSVATFFGDVQQRTGSKFTGAGAKRFEGKLTVGASPGFGTDEGDVEFGESSSYLAEIGGITACSLRCENDAVFKDSSFDKYSVAGNLSLNGILRLTSWNGFVAQAGQSFDLLDWGTLTGTFAEIDASGFKLATGTQLNYSHLYTDGSISVTVSAVPEPDTYLMLLSGIALMCAVARRRLK